MIKDLGNSIEMLVKLRGINEENINNTLKKIQLDPFNKFNERYKSINRFFDYVGNRDEDADPALYETTLNYIREGGTNYLRDLQSNLDNNAFTGTVEEQIDLYNNEIAFEESIYNSLKDVPNDITKRTQLFEDIDKFFGDYLKDTDETVHSRYRFIKGLGSIMNLNPKKFYSEIKSGDLIDEDKAPLFYQLDAVKQGMSYIDNDYSLYNDYIKYLKNKAEKEGKVDEYAAKWNTQYPSSRFILYRWLRWGGENFCCVKINC